jgi:hypothetical protein
MWRSFEIARMRTRLVASEGADQMQANMNLIGNALVTASTGMNDSDRFRARSIARGQSTALGQRLNLSA